MGWVVVLPAAVALWVLNKRFKSKGKSKKAFNILAMLIALVIGCALVLTFAGEWLAAIVHWIADLLSTLTGESGFIVGIPVGLTIGAVGAAVADIVSDKKADRLAQIAAIVAPTMLALVIGGALGDTGGQAVRTVNSHSIAVVHRLGG